jgi:hypothetical protein
MFDAYGQVATPSRIDAYLEVVGGVPVAALREGMRDAMREAQDFPPGPGTVRRCSLAIAGMRPGDPMETPRELGFRLGAGAQPMGALMSGLEARIERNYAKVIQRAKELRDERKLPATIGSRLWSLGEAERELGFREGPYACQCWPNRCGPEHEIGLAKQRADAEQRLRAAGYLQ